MGTEILTLLTLLNLHHFPSSFFSIFSFLFHFILGGARVMPMGCVFSLSTSTFFGWISPLEFMVHSIHSYSRTTRRSACHRATLKKRHVMFLRSRGLVDVNGGAKMDGTDIIRIREGMDARDQCKETLIKKNIEDTKILSEISLTN